MYTLPRFRTQWAITDNNTSLPGAEKVVYQWVNSEEDGYAKKLPETNYQVEEVPWNSTYLSESTGEWVQEPFDLTEITAVSFQRLKISTPSPNYRTTVYIWFTFIPQGFSLDSLEFEVIKHRLLAGYNTKEKLLAELAEMALRDIDPRIDKGDLIRWIWWIQEDVKIGYELIQP